MEKSAGRVWAVVLAIIVALTAGQIYIADFIEYVWLSLIIIAVLFIAAVLVLTVWSKMTGERIIFEKDSLIASKRHIPVSGLYSVYRDGSLYYFCTSKEEDENVIRGMVDGPAFFRDVLAVRARNVGELADFLRKKGFQENLTQFHIDKYSHIGNARKELHRLVNRGRLKC